MSDHDWLEVSLPHKEKRASPNCRREHQPPYHVMLWNDDHHSNEYVIEILQQLFGNSAEKSLRLAKELDICGRTTVLTTTMEHAELKQEQIHAYGVDARTSQCKASMSCTIEPDE